MSRATPQLRAFAKRLIAYESMGNKALEERSPATFFVSEKLRPHLATLMGNAGVRGLLARALALAGEEVRWLRAVHIKGDGSLEGLAELHEQMTATQYQEGRVVLLAQLLGLLVAFIGEKLTLRLLKEVWPRISLDDMTFGNGGKNEEKNQ